MSSLLALVALCTATSVLATEEARHRLIIEAKLGGLKTAGQQTDSVLATEEARDRLPHHHGVRTHRSRPQHRAALTEHRADGPVIVANLGGVTTAAQQTDPAAPVAPVVNSTTPARKQPGAAEAAAVPVAAATPVTAAAPTAPTTEAAKPAEPVASGTQDAQTTSAATSPAQNASEPLAGEPSAVAELHQDFVALQQRRTNTAMLQEALQANAALLRQTASLARASRGQARIAAENQLKSGEKMVLSMAAMVKEGRADALEAAREAAEEASVIQQAADKLAAEANAQIKLFSGAGQEMPKRAAQKHAHSSQKQEDEERDED